MFIAKKCIYLQKYLASFFSFFFFSLPPKVLQAVTYSVCTHGSTIKPVCYALQRVWARKRRTCITACTCSDTKSFSSNLRIRFFCGIKENTFSKKVLYSWQALILKSFQEWFSLDTWLLDLLMILSNKLFLLQVLKGSKLSLFKSGLTRTEEVDFCLHFQP